MKQRKQSNAVLCVGIGAAISGFVLGVIVVATLAANPPAQNPPGGSGAIITDTNGNVGIGKTPASSKKLDVNGIIDGTQLCIGGDCKTSWAAATTQSIEIKVSQSSGTHSVTGAPFIGNNPAFIKCSTGKKIVGGGCNSFASAPSVACKLQYSLALGDDGWQCGWAADQGSGLTCTANTLSSPTNTGGYAEAICL